MSDLRQSPQYANYLSQLGWVVEKLNGNYIYLKKIPLLGYFAKIQRTKGVDPQTIKLITQKYKPFRIVVEPLTTSFRSVTIGGLSTIPVTKDNHNPLYTPKFHLCKSPYLPTKTLLIDISKSEEKIVGGFAKDVKRVLAKLQITNYKSQIVGTVQQITGFHKAWRKAVPWTRYVPSLKNILALKKSFGDSCLLISNDNKCGIVFLIADKTLYYYLAWSNKRVSHTADMYRLVWEGIKLGKACGCTKFDFEGVYDERFPNKSWLGFSHFKSRFGGQEILYPGCFVVS